MKKLIPWKRKGKNTMPAIFETDWFNKALWRPFTDAFFPFSKILYSQIPSVDISEDKNEITVRAELPGMSEEDLEVSWHEGILRIRGEKKQQKEEKKKDHYYRECSYGSFCRDIPLGDTVDWKNAKAKYKHGILTISLPKTEKSSKAIEIKIT